MGERKLVVASIDNYPALNPCFNMRSLKPSLNCRMPGMFIEFLDILADRLNLTVEFYDDGDGELIFVDLINNLIPNGTVDMMTHIFSYSKSFGDAYEFTLPLYFSPTKYVVRRSDSTLTGIFDFFTVYDVYIWLGIFGFFMLFSLFSTLIHLLEIRLKFAHANPPSVPNILWQIIRMELIQFESIMHRFLSGKTLIFFFALLQCGLVIRMYNNLITTQAVRYVNPKPFKDNAELVQLLSSRKYSIMIEDRYKVWYGDIMTSIASPYYELREALRDNPIPLAREIMAKGEDSFNYTMDKVNSGGWIAIEIEETLLEVGARGLCDFVYIDTDFPPQPKALIMKKGHPLLPEINRVIVEDAIYFRRIYNKYLRDARPSKCEQNYNKPKALGIEPFYGVFILLLIGVVSGFVAFIFESIVLQSLKSDPLIFNKIC